MEGLALGGMFTSCYDHFHSSEGKKTCEVRRIDIILFVLINEQSITLYSCPDITVKAAVVEECGCRSYFKALSHKRECQPSTWCWDQSAKLSNPKSETKNVCYIHKKCLINQYHNPKKTSWKHILGKILSNGEWKLYRDLYKIIFASPNGFKSKQCSDQHWKLPSTHTSTLIQGNQNSLLIRKMK